MEHTRQQLSKAYQKIEGLEVELGKLDQAVEKMRRNDQIGPAKEKHKIFLRKDKRYRKLLKELEGLERSVAGLDQPEELSDDEALILSKMGEALTLDAEEIKLWDIRAGDIPVWLRGKVMMFALALVGVREEQIKELKAETETK